MSRYELMYFDFVGSRGEECRMALALAGVEFDDTRLARETWLGLKPTTPFGSIPVLKHADKPALAQSNAILTYIGLAHGLLPKDTWEAARHLSILEACEEVRTALAPSGKMSDPAEKQAAREALATGFLQTWGANIEKQIQGPFVGGSAPSVADVKLFQITESFVRGVLDHIPATVFQAFPKLMAVHQGVLTHPKIAAWRAKFI